MLKLDRMSPWIRLGAIAVGIKGLALMMGAHFISNSSGWINHTFVDIWSWLDFLRRSNLGQIPYVDFSKEYPVGAGMLYWILARLNPENNPTRLLHLHAWVMSLWDIGNCFLFYSILREFKAKHAFLGAVTLLALPTALILSPVRFEAVVITTVLLGYRFHRRKRYPLATAFWALGATIKFFPWVFIAAQELKLWMEESAKGKWFPLHALKAGLLALAVFGVINGPFLILGFLSRGNVDAWLGTYLFHVQRPLYWDTVLGVMHLWWGAFPIERLASLWSLGLMLLVLFTRPVLRIEKKTTLMMIAALLFNRVYSTQFHLWFYPMALVLLAEEESPSRLRLQLLVLFALDLVNVLIYPFTFSGTLIELGSFENRVAGLRAGPMTVAFSILIFVRVAILLVPFWFWMKKNPPSNSMDGGF